MLLQYHLTPVKKAIIIALQGYYKIHKKKATRKIPLFIAMLLTSIKKNYITKIKILCKKHQKIHQKDPLQSFYFFK